MSWKPGEDCATCGNRGVIDHPSIGLILCPACQGLCPSWREGLTATGAIVTGETLGDKISSGQISVSVLVIVATGVVLWLSPRNNVFLWGVFAGALGELLIIAASRWAHDRVQWMRWFSR